MLYLSRQLVFEFPCPDPVAAQGKLRQTGFDRWRSGLYTEAIRSKEMRLHRRFNPVDSFRAKILLLALAACIVMGFAARSILLRNIEVQAADQYKWKMYTNARFQYSICYPPDLLVPQGEPENADGQKFLAKDGAKLIVFGRHNAL